VGQRASDDPEDLTGCGLPRQCLTHLCGRLAGHARLLLQLIEQPNVLDSDHGLVGACLEKRDVFVTKGLGLPDADRTDWTTLAENRDEDSTVENPPHSQAHAHGETARSSVDQPPAPPYFLG